MTAAAAAPQPSPAASILLQPGVPAAVVGVVDAEAAVVGPNQGRHHPL